jgi:hypothetical protein
VIDSENIEIKRIGTHCSTNRKTSEEPMKAGTFLISSFVPDFLRHFFQGDMTGAVPEEKETRAACVRALQSR